MSPNAHPIVLAALLSLATTLTPNVAPCQDPPAPAPSPAEIERGRELRALDAAAADMAAGKAARAEMLLQSVVERAPDLEVAWYQLAIARMLQGKADGAITAVDAALARRADFPEARILWIELSVEREPDKCREFATELLKHKDVASLRRPLLPHLIALRMLDQAEEALKELRTEAPKDVDLLKLQANLQIEGGKPEAAAASLEEMLAIEPKDPHSLNTLAKLYEATGATDKVLPTWERLVAVNPSNVAARQRVIEMLSEREPASPKLDEHRKLMRYYQRRGEGAAADDKGDKKAPPAAPPKGGR
jgi:predicted Zn-dependent protease